MSYHLDFHARNAAAVAAAITGLIVSALHLLPQ